MGVEECTVSEGSAINLNGHKLYVDGKEYAEGSASSGEAFEIKTEGGAAEATPEGGNGGSQGDTGGEKPSGEPPEKPDKKN